MRRLATRNYIGGKVAAAPWQRGAGAAPWGVRRRLFRRLSSGPWLLWLCGALVGLAITAQWFSPGRLLAGGDNFPPFLIDPGLWLHRMRYAWDLAAGGGPNSLIEVLPQIVVNALLRTVLAPAEAQRVFYLLLYAAQFLATVAFVRTILPGHRVAAYLAALFYCFNPFVVLVPPGYLGLFLLVYMPYMGTVFLWAAARPMRVLRLAVFALSAGMSGILFVNPPLFAVFLIFALIMVVHVVLQYGRQDRAIFLRVGLLAVLFIVANVYWVAQAYFVLFGSGHQQVIATAAQDWSFVARRSSILNMFWLNPTWAWYYYFPYAGTYNTPPLLLTVYMPALLAFSALLNPSLPRRIVLPATAFALVLLLTSTGLHGPWQDINAFFYAHVPLFWLFREPDAKFPFLILVLYAPLIGYQVEWLAGWVARVAHRPSGATAVRACIMVALGAVFVVTAFPLVTGAVVGRSFASPTPAGVALPSYWSQVGDYLARQSTHGGVLLLPNDDFYQMQYSWGYYGADVLAGEFISNPIDTIVVGGGYTTAVAGGVDLNGRIVQAVNNAAHPTILPYLEAQGIEFILQRNDIVTDAPGRHVLSAQQVRSYLLAQPYLHAVRSFGKLDLYAVDRRFYVSRIYAAALPRPSAAGKGQVTMADKALMESLGMPGATSGAVAQSRHDPGVMRVPWTEIDPVRMAARVDVGARPLMLVYATAYNPNWHACIVPVGTPIQPWTCVLSGFLPAQQHVLALGLFNGWVLTHPGRYTVIIDLGTQHVTDLAALLSGVTVGGLLLAALVVWSVRRTRRPVRAPRPVADATQAH